jgi:SAM-dependent methyltransferase
MKEKKDIANETDLYPIIISSPIFKNLHKELLYSVGKFMESRKEERSLLILGLSPIISPYADNKDWFLDMMGSGSVIGYDYNLKILSKALFYLKDKQYLDEKLFSAQINVTDNNSLQNLVKYVKKTWSKESKYIIDKLKVAGEKIKDIKNKEIILQQGNLNYGINLQNNSVDCVDASLTLHHVAGYKQQFKYVMQEIFRVLKSDGLFHYGDVFSDMRVCESKINKIMNEMTHLTGLDMIMYDSRDEEWRVTAKYIANKNYEETPNLNVVKSKPLTNMPMIEVKSDGKIYIPIVTKKEDYLEKLNKLGYLKREIYEDQILIPIIDPDVEITQIKNAVTFRKTINELKQGMYKTTNFEPELIKQTIERGEKEHQNIINGLYEYFCDRKFIKDTMKEVGFGKILDMYPNEDYNFPTDVGAILAYKP